LSSQGGQAAPGHVKKGIVVWRAVWILAMDVIHKSCPSWIPRWLPGDYRREWSEPRTETQNGERDARLSKVLFMEESLTVQGDLMQKFQRCQDFILLLVSLWTFAVPSEQSVLFSKSNI
jgi:hypothetical protein